MTGSLGSVHCNIGSTCLCENSCRLGIFIPLFYLLLSIQPHSFLFYKNETQCLTWSVLDNKKRLHFNPVTHCKTLNNSSECICCLHPLTCRLRAPPFALLLLLAVFVLVLAELQEALGDLVVGLAALEVSGGQGEGVEAFPFGFGALGLQPGQRGGGGG